MLDGVASPMQYAEECYKRKYPAMSITEHGHMASVPEAYAAFKQYGVKYIPGCEIYYNDFEPKRQEMLASGINVRSLEWRRNNPELAGRIIRNRHLTVICKNRTGFENLLKLTTQAYETGLFGVSMKQYNRIWFEKLCEYREGLIILSGCLNGPVNHELRCKQITDREGNVIREVEKKERLENAIAYIKKFKAIFGDDYYIELQMPGVEGDVFAFQTSVMLADHFKIKTVLANDSHYMERKDFQIQKIMMAIAQETTIDSPDLFHVNSDEQYFKSRPDLYDRFINNEYSKGYQTSIFENSCDHSLEIAEKCENIEFNTDPKIPSISNADDELRHLVAKRLVELGLNKVDKRYIIDGREVTYTEQAKIELNRFIEKGFASYFLITKDIIEHGKGRGWPFTARGSAGGSLVCYLLRITSVDPLAWGLSFDRFLAPSRGGYMLNVTMPKE
jgi:DNA polymerase-3 subunit alpha